MPNARAFQHRRLGVMRYTVHTGGRRTSSIGSLAARASPGVVRHEEPFTLKRDDQRGITMVPLPLLFRSQNASFRMIRNEYFIPIGAAAVEKTFYVRIRWVALPCWSRHGRTR